VSFFGGERRSAERQEIGLGELADRGGWLPVSQADLAFGE